MSAVIAEQEPWPTVTGLPGSPPAVFEDPSLPHQPVLSMSGHHQIVLSCNCLTVHRRNRGIIESRTGAFPAAEAMAAYRQWHAGRGEQVQS